MSQKNLFAVVAGVVTLAVSGTAVAQDGWVSLFDGKSIGTEWDIKSGFATYRVQDGAIVGKTAEGSGNTFLCTKKEYGDFELEFEVKVDDALNSGVQIRSKLKSVDHKGKTTGYGGRVYGPQVELEASPGQAGFIYGEATGLGWLSPEPGVPAGSWIIKPDGSVSVVSEGTKLEVAHTHMKNGAWNKIRIVAKGPQIQTWINGNMVADLTQEEIYKEHKKGIIGLQVHGIKKGTGPYEVAWRNLRIKETK
tara:strand:+ start:1802 stop:2551 length:750 start_codon:yes stop_codon:yes gene_type:complete